MHFMNRLAKYIFTQILYLSSVARMVKALTLSTLLCGFFLCQSFGTGTQYTAFRPWRMNWIKIDFMPRCCGLWRKVYFYPSYEDYYSYESYYIPVLR